MSTYRLIGSSGSPYSIKLRSYMRYKQLEHKWLVRNTPEVMEEHQLHAKLPLVPTLIQVSESGDVERVLQDSTPIMEQLEKENPHHNSVHPTDPAMRFVSELLEEFADEWGNKWMMHFRWYSANSEPDAAAYSRRIAVELRSGAGVDDEDVLEEVNGLSGMFKERMLGRGFTVGSNETTAPIIEQSYRMTLSLLNRHLESRDYLFGGRPAFADFGLSGQLYQMLTDVTGGELMRLHAPNVALWAERMLNPTANGEFESWHQLSPTLQPVLASQVSMFLKWSTANAAAVASKSAELKVSLGDTVWEQSVGGPQRYHAKALAEIQSKFRAAEAATEGQAGRLLAGTGCVEWLSASGSKL